MNRDVINLFTRKVVSEAPSSKFVTRDRNGDVMFAYTVSYEFEGRDYSFTIWAHDQDDAENRLNHIRRTGNVDGQVYETKKV